MLVFMAGARNTGAFVASSVVVNMSSASPTAAFARKLAVAGATSKRSARFASAMCSTLCVGTLSHMLVTTACPLISRKVSSVTKVRAAWAS